MNPTPEAGAESGPERRGERRRKARPVWKRRRFWILVVAIGLAIVVAFWLISAVGNLKPPDE